MKKLNKAQQEKVEIAKQTINNLQDSETIIYDELLEELNDGEESDWLFDYIFNCRGDNDAYTLEVKNHIFE
jgi:hypothetical protein